MTLLRALSSLARPFLGQLDPEFAHTLTIKALRAMGTAVPRAADDPRLRVKAFGLEFPNRSASRRLR